MLASQSWCRLFPASFLIGKFVPSVPCSANVFTSLVPQESLFKTTGVLAGKLQESRYTFSTTQTSCVPNLHLGEAGNRWGPSLPGFGHLCCGKRRVAEGRLICVRHWRGNGNGSNKSYRILSGFPMAGPVPGGSMQITSFHSRTEYFPLLGAFLQELLRSRSVIENVGGKGCGRLSGKHKA